MDLLLTSEQRLLSDSAAKFVQEAGAKVARSFRGKQPAFAPARLRQAAELGWLSILVPEAAGGLGLGLTELALVLHNAGRGLVCEPLGLAAVSAFAIAQQPEASPLLEAVMAGTTLIVPAFQESTHGDNGAVPAVRADLKGGGGAKLKGRKVFVCGDGADGFLVSASGSDGPILCHVARDAGGCRLSMTPTVEGRPLATLDLDDTPADIVANASARDSIENLNNLVLIALSAELLGVMEMAHEITLAYLGTRKQFGKLIGSFQALQHKAVDNYIRIEATRSLIFQTAASSDPSRVDPALAAAVKAQASEAAMFVTKSCIQLHGAIGFTDEHDIGLYHKRALLLSSLFGDEAQQRRRYARLTA